jgi:peptidoglycan biosynthesis protein MviN/MurJ (putative lipid II flippase)
MDKNISATNHTHSIAKKSKKVAELGYLLATFFASIALPVFSASKIQNVITDVTGILQSVIRIVFILAIIAFGWGIVKLIVAAGDPNEIKNAKGIIVWSVISIAVLASITGIIFYIQDFFGIDPSQTTIKPPQFTP